MKTEESTDLLEELDFTIPCDSSKCQEVYHRGTHDADWLISLSCGCFMYWCNSRFIEYGKLNSKWGTLLACQSCKARYQEVRSWAPLR